MELFEAGEDVDVVGTTKGKGFAGVMKRHGFHGVSSSHGSHRNHRKPGSIGGCATPGRVFRGMRMAGRMGGVRQTTLNLTLHGIDTERGLLLIKESYRPQGRHGARSRCGQAAQRQGGLITMTTVDVLTPAGKADGTVELPAEIFDVQTNVPLIHQVVVAQLAAARRAPTPPRRGATSAAVAEALPPEGHRPGPPGLDPRAAVRRRWRGPWTAPA